MELVAILSRRVSGPPRNSPPSLRMEVTSSCGAVGGPSLRLRWTPMPRLGADLAAARAESKAAPLASMDVLVTMPLRWASRMPRLTPSVQARSSALTMRFFIGGLRWAMVSGACRLGWAIVFRLRSFARLRPAQDDNAYL